MVSMDFDSWQWGPATTTLIVAIGAFIVVGLWWMARRAARRPDD
jgi:hypothetical protein